MAGLYRSRVDGGNIDYVARFSSSLADDKRIFEEDIDGTEAHDIMLHEQGIIEREDLVTILGALEKLRREWEAGRTRLEGKYEDVHEFIEACVIDLVGMEAGGKLHTGRSRNDQVALDIRMRLRKDLNSASNLILELVDTLFSKAEAHLRTPFILYTHTQHAQIGTFGHYLLAYAEMLLRDAQRLQDCYDRVNLSPLGAGPVGGTSLGINRDRTAMLLGFDGLVKNSLDATSSRDFMLEAAACLATLMVSMSRLVEDLILWSSSEFGFVELSDEFASVSSIMPQKKNPTILELIRGKTGRVIGDLSGLLSILKGIPSGYSSDLQETKPLLWDSCDQTADSLRVLSNAIFSLTVNAQHSAEVASMSYVFATDLAERLVEERLLSFREAHHVVGHLVREMVTKKMQPKNLSSRMIEGVAQEVLGRKVNVGAAIIRDVKDPEKSIMMRKSLGSPNPGQCEHLLKELREEAAVCAAALSTRREKVEATSSRLKTLVKEFLSCENRVDGGLR